MRILANLNKISILILVFCLAACKGRAGQDQVIDPAREDTSVAKPTEYPELVPPIMDGKINDVEWKNAVVHLFEDGSELYLMVIGEHLYVAIRSKGEGMIAGNVFLSEEDRIRILHTSAALGTAIYEEEGEMYKKIQDFSWCCRSKIDDETSRFAREEFYSSKGWLGNNSFLGTANELEYKIKLENQTERLAVNFLHADDVGMKLVWPVHLEDGVALPVSGGFPDLMEFSVDDWISLKEVR